MALAPIRRSMCLFSWRRPGKAIGMVRVEEEEVEEVGDMVGDIVIAVGVLL